MIDYTSAPLVASLKPYPKYKDTSLACLGQAPILHDLLQGYIA